jgi:hypothetical protein
VPSEFVVTAESTVEIPILFESEQLGQFRAPLTYLINKTYSADFIVAVNVVKPRVQIVDNILELNFSSKLSSEMQKNVELRNDQNAQVKGVRGQKLFSNIRSK